MQAALICALLIQGPDLPFEPVNLWQDGKALPVNTERISPGRYRLSAGETTLDLYVREIPGGRTVIVRPPQNVSLSFRLKGKAHAVRLGAPPGRRVMQFAVGEPVSYLNDGLYFPEERRAVRFAGPPLLVYGGDSGAVKVEFTRLSDSLTVTRLDDPFEVSLPPVPLPPKAADVWSDFLSTLSWTAGGGLLDPKIPFPGRAAYSPRATADEARAWATLFALVGRFPTDPNGTAPPRENALILMRAPHTVEVRPLDLFRSEDLPEIVVTHIRTGSYNYAAVGIFNVTERHRTITAAFGELGLTPEMAYSVFDFWNGRYFGVFAGTIAVTLPPQSARLFFVRRAPKRPHLIGTSSNALGLLPVQAAAAWDRASGTLSGGAVLKQRAPMSLYFADTAPGLQYVKPTARADRGAATLQKNRGFWRLELQSDEGGAVNWSITFEGRVSLEPPQEPDISIGAGAPWLVALSRKPESDREHAGYYVFRNNVLVGFFADLDLLDGEVTPNAGYAYSVVAVDYAESLSLPTDMPVRTPWPDDGTLLNLPVLSWEPSGRPPRRNLSSAGGPLILDGKRAPGYGVAPPSRLGFRLYRAFRLFQGSAGLEDGSPEGASALFRVLGDGKTLWESGPVRRGTPAEFELDVSGVYRLTLEVRTGGEAEAAPLAAWFNPQLKAKPRP
ncbi:MAG: NPCBM/NEW2 domain-containing protein [Armatimonadetes bacterium]|nr:NPCBM/NEW2 domain-containing protein [Armatimonadota bacterium]